MAEISFSNTQTGVNTDRIAASSRAFTPSKSERADNGDSARAVAVRSSYKANPADPFVEIDGKRYYLNAPRGTYLDILV